MANESKIGRRSEAGRSESQAHHHDLIPDRHHGLDSGEDLARHHARQRNDADGEERVDLGNQSRFERDASSILLFDAEPGGGAPPRGPRSASEPSREGAAEASPTRRGDSGNYLEFFGILWDYLKPFGIIWDYLRGAARLRQPQQDYLRGS